MCLSVRKLVALVDTLLLKQADEKTFFACFKYLGERRLNALSSTAE
jgi:hypothetical protein